MPNVLFIFTSTDKNLLGVQTVSVRMLFLKEECRELMIYVRGIIFLKRYDLIYSVTFTSSAMLTATHVEGPSVLHLSSTRFYRFCFF